MAGNTPVVNKAGHYTGPSGEIGFWFNLRFGDWVYAYASAPVRAANTGAPVIHLGEANVDGQCSFRVTFRVPDVPPGIYNIVPIQHDRESAAAFMPLEFRVIG